MSDFVRDEGTIAHCIKQLQPHIFNMEWHSEEGKALRAALVALPRHLLHRLAHCLLSAATLNTLLAKLPYALHGAVMQAVIAAPVR